MNKAKENVAVGKFLHNFCQKQMWLKLKKCLQT
ncbi:MAG: hypothetical protein JWR61_5007 [Ferruginibacter sp.]|nr:hypothetical protein [Ferruginibacter sp.]